MFYLMVYLSLPQRQISNMTKIIFLVFILLLHGCSSLVKNVNAVDSCENMIIGDFIYADFIDELADDYPEINCRNSKGFSGLSVLREFVSKGGSPRSAKNWGESLPGLGLEQIFYWHNRNFQLAEAKKWRELGVDPEWVLHIRDLGLSFSEASIIIDLGMGESAISGWVNTSIPAKDWDLWLSVGVEPVEAGRLVKAHNLNSRIKSIQHLSLMKFNQSKDGVDVDSWVCSSSNSVGRVISLRFDSAEIVIRKKAISVDGYPAPKLTLFRPVKGSKFKLISKAERVRTEVSEWALCPESVISEL